VSAPFWVKGMASAMAFFGVLLALPSAVALVALADGVTVDRTHSQSIAVEHGATLSVEAVSANIKIVAGPAGEVRVDERDSVRTLTRRLASAALDRLSTSLEPSSTGVLVTPSSGSFNTIGGYERREITIYAPSDVVLAVDAVSGDLEVSGLRGDISVVSESGSVKLNGVSVTGKASVHLVSGDIEFRGAIDGGQVDLSTVSGSIHAYLPAGTNLHYQASTVSGGVGIGANRPRPEFGPGPGRARSGDLGTGGPASLTMNAISGDISLTLT